MRFANDLRRDKIAVWLNQTYAIWAVVGLALPTLLGALRLGGWTGALKGFLWGGWSGSSSCTTPSGAIGSIAHSMDSQKGRDANCTVVVNHEDQYSIWPVDRERPPGWTIVGNPRTREECLAYVKDVWTDMRPRSLRERMEAARRHDEQGLSPTATIPASRRNES